MDARARSDEVGSPSRARVLRVVAAARSASSVEEVAARVGIGVASTRKHLDQLARDGLVEVDAERSGRRGRPRLRYRRAGPSTADAYERLARLLVEVVATGDAPDAVGRRHGRAVTTGGDEAPEAVLVRAMAAEGFDPALVVGDGGRVLTFRRCPYASAALDAPGVVCALHRGFADGVLGRHGADPLPPGALEVRDPRVAGCRLHLDAPPR